MLSPAVRSKYWLRAHLRMAGGATSAALVLLGATGVAPRTVHSQDAVIPRRIAEVEDRTHSLELREVFRVGSLGGPNDSFGRVMSAALAPNGKLFVADDKANVVAVFDGNGRFMRNLGRDGAGPGEFRQPWLVAVDAHDSLYVWDAALARVSIFSPELRYVRAIRVPAYWSVVNSMAFLPSGEILVSAFGGADDSGIQMLARDGSILRSYHEIPRTSNLLGFEASLLGGTLDAIGDEIVYSSKSPYEVSFYRAGRLISRCQGSPTLTTRPQDAIERVEGRTSSRLNWTKYVHVAAVTLVDSGLVVNVIMDPMRDTRIVDLVTSDCRLIKRTRLKAPVTLVDRVGSRMVAVSNVKYPEVIVYAMTIARTQR